MCFRPGSNSCYYDGKKIFGGPSLSFIMGDEASGNVLEKILSLYFNNIMPDELKKMLEASFETDIAIVMKGI